MYQRQSNYHFGEFRVLRHYNETEGWLGFRFYELSNLSDLKSSRFTKGGLQIRETFSQDKIAALVDARGMGRTDSGEPDVFLYKPSREAEEKKSFQPKTYWVEMAPKGILPIAYG
jgi:hypothetical protein